MIKLCNSWTTRWSNSFSFLPPLSLPLSLIHTHTHTVYHSDFTPFDMKKPAIKKLFRHTNMKVSRHSAKFSVAPMPQWMTDVFLCSFVGCWGGKCSHSAISDTEAEGREGSAKVPSHTCSFTYFPEKCVLSAFISEKKTVLSVVWFSALLCKCVRRVRAFV